MKSSSRTRPMRLRSRVILSTASSCTSTSRPGRQADGIVVAGAQQFPKNQQLSMSSRLNKRKREVPRRALTTVRARRGFGEGTARRFGEGHGAAVAGEQAAEEVREVEKVKNTTPVRMRVAEESVSGEAVHGRRLDGPVSERERPRRR
ncbi:hypothetical protein G7046_g8383 [Stylonectria norvegica]|nr:hypothetical protein G7046_g8383 [Stylonectria norvegica]